MDQAKFFRGGQSGPEYAAADDVPEDVLNELIQDWGGSLFGGVKGPGQDFLPWQDLRAFNLLPGIAESFLEILIIVWVALTVWCCAGGAARRVKHAHGRKGLIGKLTEWEGSHDPLVAAALAPVQAAWLLAGMPIHAMMWVLRTIVGTIWAMVQFLGLVGVMGFIGGSDEDWVSVNKAASSSDEPPMANKKKAKKKQKQTTKRRSVEKNPVGAGTMSVETAEVRDMDPRASTATMSEDEYLLRKLQEEEEAEAARMHAAVRMRERRESEFVGKIERESSLEKEKDREAVKDREATKAAALPKKGKKPRPAPVIVPPNPSNGVKLPSVSKSPTKPPPPLPRGPPPANQPKKWTGTPGTRPPLPAGLPPVPSPTTGHSNGRASSSFTDHADVLHDDEQETRLQDELVNSMLESLTSVEPPPGFGGAGSAATTPTGTGGTFGGNSMWSPSGVSVGSDGGFSLFSGSSSPTSPTARELERRKNRYSQ